MNLIIIRAYSDICTKGQLSIGDQFECYTLELPTPIPEGDYEVIITPSSRATGGQLWTPDLGFRLPLLVNVPGHTGIRIHAGNSVANTQGCILVGQTQVGDTLGQSRAALTSLLAKLKEPIWLSISS
jgi:Family of unknown function (DUF5675)